MGTSFLQIHKIKTLDDFKRYDATETVIHKSQEVLKTLPYYQTHKIRKNGNIAIHIYMRCDLPQGQMPQWLQTNLAWVKEYFNVPCKVIGSISKVEDNYLVNHVYVIPISPAGRISYEYYCNSNAKMRLIQSSYADKMKLFFGLKRTQPSINKRSARMNLYKTTDHPSVLPPVPTPDSQDVNEYYTQISQYIAKMQNFYESKQNINSDTLVVENKYLKKENQKLNQYLGPFVQLIEQYGGIKKINMMLKTAQQLQYATRYYQENGDQDSLDNIEQIIRDAHAYIEKHR